jgi:hypothetical protein
MTTSALWCLKWERVDNSAARGPAQSRGGNLTGCEVDHFYVGLHVNVDVVRLYRIPRFVLCQADEAKNRASFAGYVPVRCSDEAKVRAFIRGLFTELCRVSIDIQGRYFIYVISQIAERCYDLLFANWAEVFCLWLLGATCG